MVKMVKINLFLYFYYTIFYYFASAQYLVILFLSIDNLCISYNTICDIYHFKYKIKVYNTLYIDRYIYYLILIILKSLSHLLLYTYEDYFLKFTFYIIGLMMMENLLTHHFICTIKLKLYQLYKYCIYTLFGFILKHICLMTLKIDPSLSYKEVRFLYKQNYKNNIFTLIKSFILMVIITTISEGNTFTLNVIKRIYNIKAIHPYKDPYPNLKSDLHKIQSIIHNRQWSDFFNPYIIHIITNLYDNNKSKTVVPIISSFIKTLELCTTKSFVILTISKLTLLYDTQPHYFLIGILSFLLCDHYNIKTIIIKIMGILASYYYNNYIIGIFICEYSHLLFSNLIHWLYSQCIKLLNNNKYILTHINKYNIYIIIHILYLSYSQKFILNILFLLNSKYPVLTIWFLILGYHTKYNTIHLIILGIVWYISIHIYYIKQAPTPKLNVLFITNYTEPPKKTLLLTYYKTKIIHDDYKPPSKKPITYNPTIYQKLNLLNMMHNPKYNITPEITNIY